MKLSARNVFKGTIKDISEGPVNVDLVVDIGAGIEVSSVITKKSRERLGLEVGKEVEVIIKASNVMIGVE